MIRIICHETDYADAVNVGGPVDVRHKTFDVELPEIEAWLKETHQWRSRGFTGIEVMEAKE